MRISTRPLFIVACFVWQLAATGNARSAKSPEQLLQETRASLVHLETRVTLPTGEVVRGAGTGFVVSDQGYVLTASHVLSPSGIYDKHEVRGSRATRHGDRWPLNVIEDDPEKDLLLLKFKDVGISWQPLSVRSPAGLGIGAPLFVLGFPFEFDLTSKRGELSNRSDGPRGGWLVSVPLNRGDSGAPVLDEEGRVAAIVTGGLRDANLISFCTPIDRAATLLAISGFAIAGVSASQWSEAPKSIEPEDGAAFVGASRRLKLAWGPVAAAYRYLVEVQVQDPADSSWHPHSRGYGQKRVAASSIEFDFLGASVGRWRVSAVDRNDARGAFSAWSYFEFQEAESSAAASADSVFSPALTLQYSYTHNGANCNGYFSGDGLGNWRETTSAQGGCLETLYLFRQQSRTAEVITLFDEARGYYLELPLNGGPARLATSREGPYSTIHNVKRVNTGLPPPVSRSAR